MRRCAEFEIARTAAQQDRGNDAGATGLRFTMPGEVQAYVATAGAVAIATILSTAIETIFPITSLSLIYMTALDRPAVIIVNPGLPDADRISVLAATRGWSAVLVLGLAMRGDEAGKVAAFDVGAQDHVAKPFGIEELLARLRGLLRDHAVGVPQGGVPEIGDLGVDAASRRVEKAGVPVRLTRKEFDLLWLPAAQAGRLIP